MTKKPAKSYMEIRFYDPDPDSPVLLYTDMRWAGKTNQETRKWFRVYQQFKCSFENATFALYYRTPTDAGRLETINLDDKGFEKVTGEKPKSEIAYHKIHREIVEAKRT